MCYHQHELLYRREVFYCIMPLGGAIEGLLTAELAETWLRTGLTGTADCVGPRCQSRLYKQDTWLFGGAIPAADANYSEAIVEQSRLLAGRCMLEFPEALRGQT